MKITADFTRKTGNVIKPMHGGGQPPMLGTSDRFFHYLTEAGIPYSRLHDVGGPYGEGRFVDIPNIFRNFDADVEDPASYDFVFTDKLLADLNKAGIEPFYRLGVTIENDYRMKSYRLDPPKDTLKWARICEHIIRHYNEGWANGFHYGIKYWEIWNEPDGEKELVGGDCFHGTQEEYFRMYEVTAKHLKQCFGDSIMVGGYASTGFHARAQDPELNGIYPEKYETDSQHWIDFFHDFLKYIGSEEHKSPIDFFSWHTYAHDPREIPDWARYCRKVLTKYGFGDVPDILDEWNPAIGNIIRSEPVAAARIMATMLLMQKEITSLMTYYDTRIGPSRYGGVFNPDTWAPYKSYYAFMGFNELYKLKNEVFTASDDETICVGGATNGRKSVLVISNISDKAVECELELGGAENTENEIIRIDDVYTYTLCGQKIKDNKITMPPYGVAVIRFREE